ncbi:MAG: hypothetical protein M0R77_00015 [Gammaproteobacteria bacterium]|nr:hypothetical protein [Acholeplasmataceae bacterium]MCK9528938.1 hypothetical protein [Gammaproteobacteria bacterium]
MNIIEWFYIKNNNDKLFRVINSLEPLAKKYGLTENPKHLPNILAMLKVLKEEKHNNIPLTLFITRLVYSDVNCLPEDDFSLSLEVERAVRNSTSSEAKDTGSSQVIREWLIENTRHTLAELLTLFFLFQLYEFEDENNFFSNLVQEYKDDYKDELEDFCSTSLDEHFLNEINNPLFETNTDLDWIKVIGIIITQI